MSLSPEPSHPVRRVHATIPTVLLKRACETSGSRTKPLRPGTAVVGPPLRCASCPREDIRNAQSWSSPISTRTAIEAIAARLHRVSTPWADRAGIFVESVRAHVTRGVARCH